MGDLAMRTQFLSSLRTARKHQVTDALWLTEKGNRPPPPEWAQIAVNPFFGQLRL